MQQAVARDADKSWLRTPPDVYDESLYLGPQLKAEFCFILKQDTVLWERCVRRERDARLEMLAPYQKVEVRRIHCKVLKESLVPLPSQ